MMRHALVLILGTAWLANVACGYDPLEVTAGPRPATVDLDVVDGSRDRAIPIRVFMPPNADAAASPVVLFSHGLGGSRTGNCFLGDHWSRRGYVVIFLQHPGSDDSVWRDVPPGQRLAAMRGAASAENFRLRVQDVSAVLDRLARWSEEAGHPLAGRLALDAVGMAGHSFGAQTTQAVAGQSFPLVGRRYTDRRIQAAVVMSPGSPRGRLDPGDAFAGVTVPWLLMTGTHDTSVIGGQTVESRLAVFPALPVGRAYELVLDHAEHSAFTDRALPGDHERRNENHHRAILSISTAFWDAFLRKDAAARDWLDGDAPRGILEPADRWQKR